MTPSRQLFYCTAANLLVLSVVTILIVVFKDKNSKYFRFGPQDDLEVISIFLNTWTKYLIFVSILASLKACEVFVHEFGFPIISFRVYDPDKKVITDFSKNELQIYTNVMCLATSLRYIMFTVVSVTQIDIALINCVIAEFTGIFTTRALLNKKNFVNVPTAYVHEETYTRL